MYLARFDADQMSLTIGTTGAYGQFIPTWEFPRVFVDERDATNSLLKLGYTPQPWTEGPGPFGVFMELAEIELPPRFFTLKAQFPACEGCGTTADDSTVTAQARGFKNPICDPCVDIQDAVMLANRGDKDAEEWLNSLPPRFFTVAQDA